MFFFVIEERYQEFDLIFLLHLYTAEKNKIDIKLGFLGEL